MNHGVPPTNASVHIESALWDQTMGPFLMKDFLKVKGDISILDRKHNRQLTVAFIEMNLLSFEVK